MTEFFQQPFMVRALISSVLIGALCGLVGAFVVLKRLSFLSEGVGHASVLGIAVGLLIGVSPLSACFVFAILFAVLLAGVTRSGRIGEDAAIGVLFSTSLALGVLLLSKRPMNQGDLTRLFFGDLLTITSLDVLVTAVMAACIAVLIAVFFRPLSILIFDEQYAARLGIPVRLATMFLYAVVSITIVASIRLVGALLVTSLLVVPASLCLRRSQSLPRLAGASTALGVAICTAGIVLSYFLDTPPGATIVVCAGALFGLQTVTSLPKDAT